jgi:hypothetical protein
MVCGIAAAILLVAVATAQTSQTTVHSGPSGWLILRGELMPAPYSVEIVGEEVMVNGYGLKSTDNVVVEAEATRTSSENAHYRARQQAFDDFWLAWDSWCKRDGVETARQRALEYWRTSSLAWQAYFPDAGRPAQLTVLFRGDTQAESVELRPAPEDVFLAGQARADQLRELAHSLDYSLTHGDLVIVQDEGNSYTSTPGDGEAILRQIRQITGTVGDPDVRFAAIRQIVPGDAMAKAIAEHFQP